MYLVNDIVNLLSDFNFSNFSDFYRRLKTEASKKVHFKKGKNPADFSYKKRPYPRVRSPIIQLVISVRFMRMPLLQLP